MNGMKNFEALGQICSGMRHVTLQIKTSLHFVVVLTYRVLGTSCQQG